MNLINSIKLEIVEQIENNIKRNYSINKIPKLVIRLSENDQFGDFTTTIALQIKSIVNKPPIEIAKEITENINIANADIERIDVVAPGHINFYLHPSWKIKVLGELIRGGHEFMMDFVLHPEDIADVNYITNRIETIIYIFERERIVPNYDTLKWSHIDLVEEKEIFNLFVRVTSNELFKEKDINNLVKETIKKFYEYHNKLQFRKLDNIKLNVVLNIFLGIRSILKAFN